VTRGASSSHSLSVSSNPRYVYSPISRFPLFFSSFALLRKNLLLLRFESVSVELGCPPLDAFSFPFYAISVLRPSAGAAQESSLFSFGLQLRLGLISYASPSFLSEDSATPFLHSCRVRIESTFSLGFSMVSPHNFLISPLFVFWDVKATKSRRRRLVLPFSSPWPGPYQQVPILFLTPPSPTSSIPLPPPCDVQQGRLSHHCFVSALFLGRKPHAELPADRQTLQTILPRSIATVSGN